MGQAAPRLPGLTSGVCWGLRVAPRLPGLTFGVCWGLRAAPRPPGLTPGVLGPPCSSACLVSRGVCWGLRSLVCLVSPVCAGATAVSSRPSFSLAHCVHRPFLCPCLSIPSVQIGPSVFFEILYAGVLMHISCAILPLYIRNVCQVSFAHFLIGLILGVFFLCVSV